jgi:phosphonoacetaldehyde hydrolase
MDNASQRTYRGPLKAAILDWAGTTVDYGSFAPTAVFIKLFANYGIQITESHARLPMGLMKKDHLRAIAQIPEVSRQWESRFGAPISEPEIDAMFRDFVPLQIDCLRAYAEPIPGALETIAAFREMGMKIGSTTGYTREMMEILAPAAMAHGYAPDACVTPSDVPAGRPYPWMCYQNAIQLQIYPLSAMVKIGDTLPDIAEGLNAGMWTVGLTLSGNLLGLTEAEKDRLSAAELQAKRDPISAELVRAGAHYVVDGLWDCLDAIEDINRRLELGEKP